MTAQMPERLRYEGQDYDLFSEPLAGHLRAIGSDRTFKAMNTANWRGYLGRWEVDGGKLYLVDLRGVLTNGNSGNLRTIFPGASGRVFADWYSGVLRVPHGELLHYAHAGFASTYEKELLVHIHAGRAVSTEMKNNYAKANTETSRATRSGILQRLRAMLRVGPQS